jgi:hypothetical protein
MKDNKVYDELDKELKDTFKDLKKAYESLETQTNNLNNLFKVKKVDYQVAKSFVNFRLYIDNLNKTKNRFDTLFKSIEVLFKIRSGIPYDCIIYTSVIQYCKGKKDYVEYSTPTHTFKKYYI